MPYTAPDSPVTASEGFAGRRVGRRIAVSSTACLLLLACAMLVAASVGSAGIPLGQTCRIILRRIPFLRSLVDVEGIRPVFLIIIWSVRLPRVVIAVLVGMAL
jgi:ABC-type Fe3+-siderophore transport system permease subunit